VEPGDLVSATPTTRWAAIETQDGQHFAIVTDQLDGPDVGVSPPGHQVSLHSRGRAEARTV
jgi:hypothetical protein